MSLTVVLAGETASQPSPDVFETVVNIGTDDNAGVIFNGVGVGGGYGIVTPESLDGHMLASDSQLNVYTGGSIRGWFHAGSSDLPTANIEVNIFGGEIDSRLDARLGSTINLFDGSIANRLLSFDGSRINVYGGSIGDHLNAMDGSVVTVSGGVIGDSFRAEEGSRVQISGGRIGNYFVALNTHGHLSDLAQEIQIDGGAIGDHFYATNVRINIAGGTIGSDSRHSGSTTITGGSIGNGYRYSGVLTIAGGEIGDGFRANEGSIEISGGLVGDNAVFLRSDVVLSGGSFQGSVEFDFASAMHIRGTSFFVDGIELTDLEIDQMTEVTSRDVQLSGSLADGSLFEFDLNSEYVQGEDFFHRFSTVTLTLVPSPGTAGMFVLPGLMISTRRRG